MFKLLIFVAFVAASLALGWMTLLPFVVTNQIRERTGFAARVTSLTANPLDGTIRIRGFVLENPEGFTVPDFVQMQEFSADADPQTLFADELVFERMSIDLASVTLVKRADGATNASVLAQRVADGQGGAPDRKRTVLVRDLELKLDKLVVVEHGRDRSSTREFNVGIVQRSKNVRELRQLLTPAAIEALAPVAAFADGFLPGNIAAAVKETTKSGRDVLRAAGRRTADVLRGLFDTLEESKKP